MDLERRGRRALLAAVVVAAWAVPTRIAAVPRVTVAAAGASGPAFRQDAGPPVRLAEDPELPLPADSVEARIARVAGGLLLPVRIHGEVPDRYDLETRMRLHGVPAVSVAVVEGGRIAWARAWGLARPAEGVGADPGTPFQAASLSKPLAALAALRLADRGLIDLDADVDRRLRGWHVRRGPAGADGVVTLRRLLSHTAGLSVHGFRGYARGEAVPGLLEILDASGRANSPPVVVEGDPGREWRYSGGGYEVMQLLVEQASRRPFEAVMREILDRLGMRSSTFAQPLPDSLSDRAAVGHRDAGTPVDGGWHTYPETAAGGLWSTPSDLAGYMIAVGRWLAGEEGGVLSPRMTREMLTPGRNGWGLGPETAGTGLDFRFSHTGASEGYRSRFVYFPRRRIGAAIMTNGEAGDALAEELLYAIADEYDWPDIAPRGVWALPLPPTLAVEYAGRYRVPEAPDLGVTLAWRRGRLELHVGGRPPSRVARVGRDRFVVMSDGAPLRFERGVDGRVRAAIAYGTRALREPR